MKQISFKIICLIAFACIAVIPGFANPTISYESVILESFNGDDDAPYIWRTDASRYVSNIRDANGETVRDSNGNTAKYPITSYVDAWPVAVFGYRTGNQNIKSFGIRGQFDRMGYNWIDLYPTLADDPDGKPTEIPIPGQVVNLDMWIWGSNLRYYVEVFLRDYRGVVHTLRLGDISYPGWRNLSVNVPNHIVQTRRTIPSYASLSFVKFRIWTQPSEKVDNFYIYFKQLKALTNTFRDLFDGNELADPDYVDRLWNN